MRDDKEPSRTPALALDDRMTMRRAMFISRHMKPGMSFVTNDWKVHTVEYVAAEGKAVKCKGESGFVLFQQIKLGADGKPVTASGRLEERIRAILERHSRKRYWRMTALLSDDEREDMRRMASALRRNGHSIQSLCSLVHISESKIHEFIDPSLIGAHWMKKRGILLTSSEIIERNRRVIEAYRIGVPVKVIAMDEGICEKHVSKIANNAGLIRRKRGWLTMDMYMRISEMSSSGMLPEDISKAMDIPVKSVKYAFYQSRFAIDKSRGRHGTA